MTQEEISQISVVLQTWGTETVRLMLTEFQKDYMGFDKTRTDLYNQFNPNLVQDVSSIAWILDLPKYAEEVDKGRLPGKYPTRDVIGKWADARGLPSYGSMSRPQFIDMTRKLVYKRGIPRVDFFKYFTTAPDNRLDELEKNLYITIGNILENDIIKIIRNVK